MDHRHVDVPFVVAGLLLGGELLVDLLRPPIAGSGADGANLDARIHRFELRREIVVDVVDHVLIARGDDVERRLGPSRASKSERGGE